MTGTLVEQSSPVSAQKPGGTTSRRSKKGRETYHVASHSISPNLIERAESLYKERRRRDARMAGTSELFGEPSWDILLDLFVAHGKARPVSVSSACIASSTPQSTALRYVGLLEKVGLIRRTKDPRDGRRQYLELTEAGLSNMQAYLSEVV
jgi:predicted transcriptional regulator